MTPSAEALISDLEQKLMLILAALEGAKAKMDAAVAAEREACAKIAEEFDDFEYRDPVRNEPDVVCERASMKKLAETIRAQAVWL